MLTNLLTIRIFNINIIRIVITYAGELIYI